MHFFNHVNTENAPPPPPNNVGMKKRFRDRLKCAGLHKLQHCLGGGGGGGEGAERKIHNAKCPKTFVLHCSKVLMILSFFVKDIMCTENKFPICIILFFQEIQSRRNSDSH